MNDYTVSISLISFINESHVLQAKNLQLVSIYILTLYAVVHETYIASYSRPQVFQ